MLFKNQEIGKLYYSIGEVAEMFEVSTSLIRYWEGEFEILKPRKNSKGTRLFTKTDIENLKIIYKLLKEDGFTVEGAKKQLKKNRSKLAGNVQIVESLEGIKGFLENLKDEL